MLSLRWYSIEQSGNYIMFTDNYIIVWTTQYMIFIPHIRKNDKRSL